MSFAFLPLYTGDYLRDTQHLSCTEHGVYLKLLIYCWDQRGPAPLDERRLSGIVNARSGDEIEAMRRVLGEFFVRMEDGWYNARMCKEIARADAISGARSSAGRAGANERMRRFRESQAIAKQVPSKCLASDATPTPTTTTIKTKDSCASAPDGAIEQGPPRREVDQRFLEFWSAYPRKKSKGQAEKAWSKLKADDDLSRRVVEGLAAAKRSPDWLKEGGRFIPYPATWLNARGWEDEHEVEGMRRVAI